MAHHNIKLISAVTCGCMLFTFSSVAHGFYHDKGVDQSTTSTVSSTNNTLSKTQQVDLWNLEQEFNRNSSGVVALGFNAQTNTPSFIKAMALTPPAGGSTTSLNQAVKRSDHFLAAHAEFLKLANPGQELTVVATNLDRLGKKHIRYQQQYRGVPLFGKELLIHENDQNSIYLFNGNYEQTPLNFDVTPEISKKSAHKAALATLKVKGAKQAHDPQLTIYTGPDNEKKLSYMVHVNPRASVDLTCFVDAKTGQVISVMNNICGFTNKVAQSSGTSVNGDVHEFDVVEEDGILLAISPVDYELQPGSASAEDTIEFKLLHLLVYDGAGLEYSQMEDVSIASQNKSAGWDPAVVSALANSEKTFSYFNTTFNRDSYDNEGVDIISVVHTGDQLNNAFFTENNVMFYGDGDGKLFSPLVGGLDVAAHEMSHGVVNHSAELVYQGQSGALNESFADFFAAMVDRDDWLVGEDVTLAKPGFLRSMKNPQAGLMAQPSKMSEYKEMDEDNGGVHVNSGIPNRAAYLVAEGLTNEGLGRSIGREDTEQIYYRALTHYLIANSQFIDARRALLQSAEDLYGGESQQVKAVALAWDTVEVFDSKPPAKKKDPVESQPAQQKKTEPAPKKTTEPAKTKPQDSGFEDDSFGTKIPPNSKQQKSRVPTTFEDWVTDVQ